MEETTLVVGATGTVGSAVVSELASRGLAVRAATRQPGAARGRWGGVEAAPFDLERPETFGPALSGVTRVFLMARPGDDEPERVAAPLIEAMSRSGVRRVVNLTAMGTESREGFGLRRVERLLDATGMEVTHLRPNWFMQVFASQPLLRGIVERGVIALPAGDGRLSFVDARDVAAVAVAALTEPGHAGRGYTLTGPEALSHEQVAGAIAAASGRAVRYVALDEGAARQALADRLGPRWAERLVGFYRLVRAGLGAPVSPDVQRVLGRPPLPFERFAADHASSWAG